VQDEFCLAMCGVTISYPVCLDRFKIKKQEVYFTPSAFFGLPGMAAKPSLRYAGVTLIRGKTIRIVRALLVTAGSEGSDRK